MANGSSNGTIRLLSLALVLGGAIVGTVLYAADRPPRDEVKAMIEDAPAIVALTTRVEMFVVQQAKYREADERKLERILRAVEALKQ